MKDEATTATAMAVIAEHLTASEKEAFRPPTLGATPPQRRPIIAGVPGIASGDSLGAIAKDAAMAVTELEKRFDDHRRRLDACTANLRATVDDIKRILGT